MGLGESAGIFFFRYDLSQEATTDDIRFRAGMILSFRCEVDDCGRPWARDILEVDVRAEPEGDSTSSRKRPAPEGGFAELDAAMSDSWNERGNGDYDDGDAAAETTDTGYDETPDAEHADDTIGEAKSDSRASWAKY